MTSTIILPSKVCGSVRIPSSKSYSQRAVAVALLKGGTTTLLNYGNSNDERVALEIIKNLGATVLIDSSTIIINSKFSLNKIFNNKIFVGESGLSLRLFTVIAALLNYEIEIRGEGSLVDRPIEIFESLLPKLDVDIKTNSGKLPIYIKGNLRLRNIEIDGEVSSQFLSGFIIAFSYLYKVNDLQNEVFILVKNLKSKPYIDLTLDVLQDFKLPTPINLNYEKFIFSNGVKENENDFVYSVEGDWSSAAFIIVAAAVAGEVCLSNLNLKSKQADRKILNLVEKIGVKVIISKSDVIIRKSESKLNYFQFDANDCPDLFPPLVVLAANCSGISIIKGVNRLKHKESNRGIVLQKEFKKLGVEIEIDDDVMRINGNSSITGGVVNSNNDHRIAMACAILALNANSPVVIENAEAVNKSYPDFFKDLKKIGVGIK